MCSKNICVLTLFVLFFSVSTLSAQFEDIAIKLVNESTSDPVVSATWKFGDQTGITDENGQFIFDFKEGVQLSLSHVNFGEWTLEEKDLFEALHTGIIKCEEISFLLQPVSIIRLRKEENEKQVHLLDFQDKMAHDGGDLLARSAAIGSIKKSGNYGFDPVLHGFKYDQLNIVIDGAQNCIAACPNRMDPPTSQVAPNMIERIEVLKGPHALRYGNSFGGTINFISTASSFTKKNDTYGRLSGVYESNGNIMRSEGRIGICGKTHDISIFGSWSQGDDYEDGDANKVGGDFQRGSFGARVGLKFFKNQQLDLSVTRNIARDTEFPALPMDLREDDTWLFNAAHGVTFSKPINLRSLKTNLYASIVDHKMDNGLKPLDPRMLNASTYAETYAMGGRTEAKWVMKKGLFYGGLDLRIDGAKGTRYREFLLGPMAGNTKEDNVWQDSQITRSGLFAEYQLHGKVINWVFSTHLELNQAKTDEPSPEFKGVNPELENTQFNPAISIGGSHNFDNGIKAGMWFGRSQRSGSLTERYINFFPVGKDPYEMVGNPEISPEVINQVDLSFGYSAKSTALQLGLFTAFLQDFISSVIDEDSNPKLPNSPGVRRFANIDNALMAGFEITWDQQIINNLQHHMSMAYTFGQDRVHDEPLPEIAPLDFRYVLSGSLMDEKLHPEISFRYVLEQKRISTAFGETEAPSFSLLDLHVGYKINSIFNIRVGVDNLLDEAYYEHLSRSVKGTAVPIYAPGRSFAASFTVDLM